MANCNAPIPPDLVPDGTPLIYTLLGTFPPLVAQVTTQSLTLPAISSVLSVI